MTRVRAVLAALGREELSGAARAALGVIVVFVPFGSLVLLTRWAPIRRALHRLGHHSPKPSEPRKTDEAKSR
jgi:hypothetical protein